MMDIRDQALQATCPVIAAPRFGDLPTMGNGQRIVVARNGVFVQVKLDWLDCMQRLVHQAPAMPLPYGEVQEHLRFSFGVLPLQLLEAFIAQARLALPNETAGALVYSRERQSLRLAMCEADSSSPAHVAYRVPAMQADETLAVDLHTHGTLPPFWSATDDRDDKSIKVAGVFGHLDRDKPLAKFRLVLNGMFVPLEHHPWCSRELPEAMSSLAGLKGWRALLRTVLRRKQSAPKHV